MPSTFIFQFFNYEKGTNTPNMPIKYSWLREVVQVGTARAITIKVKVITYQAKSEVHEVAL